MMNCMRPTPALLSKLGSLIYHMEEFLDTGEIIDKQAAQALREDGEVEEWFQLMKSLALLPVKRGSAQGKEVKS